MISRNSLEPLIAGTLACNLMPTSATMAGETPRARFTLRPK